VTIQQILEGILGQAGVVFLLLVVLWAGQRGYWVFGWYVKELHDRIERLEHQLDRATGVAERGTVAADRATRLAETRTEVPGA
jgi:hypothetical protein